VVAGNPSQNPEGSRLKHRFDDRAVGIIRYPRWMPLRHFVNVVGFDVPASGRGCAGEPLIVLLDKAPIARWRMVFRKCAGDLAPALCGGIPELHGDTIRFPMAAPMTRGQAGDIRAFVEQVNRLTFLEDTGKARL
jgi:hypothetical protein